MYKYIVAGGTFDRLHAGHKHFLKKTFEAGARVTIGLTSQRYIQKYKKGKDILPYSRRYKTLTRWLRQEGFAARATVMPLHDPFGPTLLPNGFDAIAVTRDNKKTAQEINTRRVERGLSPVAIIEIELVPAEDARPISSTRVRKGEIDTNGRLILPDALRPLLQKPMGRVLTGKDIEASIRHNRDHVTVAVGDVTTQTFFSFGVQPALAIIDLFVERKPYQSFEAYKFPKKYRIVRLKSGPGFIAKRAVKAIKEWSKMVKNRTVLVIDGEEDLLAIPALVHAPVGSILYYGQPNKGQVEVRVTPEKKKEAIEILKQFI